MTRWPVGLAVQTVRTGWCDQDNFEFAFEISPDQNIVSSRVTVARHIEYWKATTNPQGGGHGR